MRPVYLALLLPFTTLSACSSTGDVTLCTSGRCPPEATTTSDGGSGGPSSSAGVTGDMPTGTSTTQTATGDLSSGLVTGVDGSTDGDATTGSSTGADADADADGFPTPQDCDDHDRLVHPNAIDDPLDPVDADCDPATDDGDGDGYSPAFGDCDDGDSTIHPDAAETQNGVDDNCNELIDEEMGGGVAKNLQSWTGSRA